MPITIAFVVALMTALHPSAPKTGAAPAFARAIAWTVEHEPPPEGVSRELAAALLVVYGWQEGRFAGRAKRGDGELAVCAFQVHARGTYAELLERDPAACVRAAYVTMRESYRICGDLSGYAGWCRTLKPTNAAQQGMLDRAVAIAARRAREAQGILDAAHMAVAGAP